MTTDTTGGADAATSAASLDLEQAWRLRIYRLLVIVLAGLTFWGIFIKLPGDTGFPMQFILTVLWAAFIVAAAAGPIVQHFERFRIPAGVTISILVLTVLSLFLLISFLLLPLVSTQIQLLASQLIALVQTQVPALWEGAKPTVLHYYPHLVGDMDGLIARGVNTAVGYVGYVGSFANLLASLLGSIATLAGYAIIVLIVGYYFARNKLLLQWPANTFFGRNATTINKVVMRAYTDTGHWARYQLLLSVFFGCGYGIVLTIGQSVFGGEWDSFTLGLVGGVLDIIPFGSFLAIGTAFLVQLSQHNPWGMGWAIGGALVVIEFEWHILAPRTMGHALQIHPVFVLLGLFTGYEWIGVMGFLAAMPALIVARAIGIAIWPNIENIAVLGNATKTPRRSRLPWRNWHVRNAGALNFSVMAIACSRMLGPVLNLLRINL